MGIYITILEQGLIYGILALGVYITYKILDFPDLTVDGSFPLGAALTATMITRGVHPILTLPASFLIGVLAGAVPGKERFLLLSADTAGKLTRNVALQVKDAVIE